MEILSGETSPHVQVAQTNAGITSLVGGASSIWHYRAWPQHLSLGSPCCRAAAQTFHSHLAVPDTKCLNLQFLAALLAPGPTLQ